MAPDAPAASPTAAGLDVADRRGERVLAFRGALSSLSVGEIWPAAMHAARQHAEASLVLDLSAVTYCDTTGAALLVDTERVHGKPARVVGASEKIARLLDRVRKASIVARLPPAAAETWRDAARAAWETATAGISFTGEVAVALLRLPRRHRMFRGVDLWQTADQAGVRAIPLVAMLGMLMGLILAFQSFAPMHRFGADLYVADLVSISLLRELAALLAAVILAGRTGSAFAAEIGTMKVNQEIDALRTMGVDPVTMLVLPRLVAVMLVTPALTVALELAGLLGMTIVLVGSGIPPSAIASHVIGAVIPADLYGGLFKAMVFGAAVAAIGCRSGMSAGAGPRAVGEAATAAVVGGIVATIVLDGILAVIFNQLGL
jgi:phospholipid/cholesterol/gamma-HCH transport system permease protein